MPNFGLLPDDEFDALPSNTAATSNPVTPISGPSFTPQYEFESIDWDNPKPVSYGDGLDRIKPKAGETVRFALVPGVPAKAALIHYVALNGKTARMFLCTTRPDCPACLSGNDAKKNTVALVAHYTNADLATGKLAPEAVPVYRIGYISLSQPNYKDFVEAPVEGVRPADVDYRMTYDGRRYNFYVVATKSRHSQRSETAKVVAMATPFQARLNNKLGSPIPPGSVVNPPAPNGASQQSGSWADQ